MAKTLKKVSRLFWAGSRTATAKSLKRVRAAGGRRYLRSLKRSDSNG